MWSYFMKMTKKTCGTKFTIHVYVRLYVLVHVRIVIFIQVRGLHLWREKATVLERNSSSFFKQLSLNNSIHGIHDYHAQ